MACARIVRTASLELATRIKRSPLILLITKGKDGAPLEPLYRITPPEQWFSFVHYRPFEQTLILFAIDFTFFTLKFAEIILAG